LTREFDEFVVTLGQFLQRFFVRVADDRHENTVLGLDREAHVNGRRMNDLAADEPSGGRRIFR